MVVDSELELWKFLYSNVGFTIKFKNRSLNKWYIYFCWTRFFGNYEDYPKKDPDNLNSVDKLSRSPKEIYDCIIGL